MKKKLLVLSLCAVIFALGMALCSCSCSKDDNMATVTFVTYTDEKISSIEVEKGSLIEKPSISYERAGYTFVGWYSGSMPWDFEKSVVSEDITLSVKWESYLSYIDNEDGTIYVAGCDFDVENVLIPTSYNGKSVSGILRHAFADRKAIKSIVIPEGIKYIGEQAFSGCRSLESIVIPKSVTSVGKEAFNYCDKLTEIKCVATEMPSGWSKDFNKTSARVTWGHK